MMQGVCPYDRSKEGIVWAATAAGEEDERPCPSPYSGVATRLCSNSGQWESVSLARCLTAAGRQLRDTVSKLTNIDTCVHLPLFLSSWMS